MGFFKFIHRWLGAVAAIFVIMFALSGIVLNHRDFFSPFSVKREYLPADYRLGNWNLGAVKSSTPIGQDSVLLFGNIGVWLTDNDHSFFKPLNRGFKKGIDNRKTFQVLHTPGGNTYAATLSGLYILDNQDWKSIPLPVKESLVRGITLRGDSLCILTRSHLVLGMDAREEHQLTAHLLPHPEGYRARTALFRVLWIIHSGEILGLPGKILVDVMGVILIILCLTGIVWFVAPDVMGWLKKKSPWRKKMARLNRFSLRWHNMLGIWAAGILILVTLTGMFLRPPLLIAIIQSDVRNIRGTILDDPNPWHDKLRDIQWDRRSGDFIFSTSEGFYQADPQLKGLLRRMPVQPPVSIMGINTFVQPGDGKFLVGSFSGFYGWDPSQGTAHDMISGQAVYQGTAMAHPFGQLPLAGYIRQADGSEYLFDYNAGVASLNSPIPFPVMPEQIKNQTPLSLWNLALEIHTGRFYSFIFGKYYILFIPLAALTILSILLSGVVLWFRENKRKKRIRDSSLHSE